MTDETRPAPLVPADCDLREFRFMPLDVVRLRDSNLVADETPEVCWAALLLWCAAWHQVPAGSIPDSDSWQAKAAGYKARGRIDPAWEKVRDGALRGFVECSDGRLYHSIVAEKALESWRARLAHAFDRMLDRVRKANKARAEKGLPLIGIPTLDAWISGGRVDPVPVEVGGIPAENALKGQGQGREKENSPPASRVPPSPAAPDEAGKPEPVAPRATKKCPAAFVVDEALRTWAKAEAPAVMLGRETAKFRDHTFARAISDWPGAWRNWIRKANEDLAAGRGIGSNPKSFRERDADQAAAEVGAWGTGRVVAQRRGETLTTEVLPHEQLEHGA